MNPRYRFLPLSAGRPLARFICAGLAMAGPVLAMDQISIGDAVVPEGNAGTADLTFTVTRSSNEAAFTVDYTTADGTAAAPGDYTPASGTLNFTAGGSLTETITVPIIGETSPELDENFLVNLSGVLPAGAATIADAQAAGTILDDDRTVPVMTTQPIASQAVVAGNNFTLTAAASGIPAPVFQWFAGTSGDTASPISGATSANLTTSTAVDRTYWVRATNSKGSTDSGTGGVTVAADTNALLAALTLDTGTLSPAFDAVTRTYSASEANVVTSVALTPSTAMAGATLTAAINGGEALPVTSGSPVVVALNPGNNTLSLQVTAPDAATSKTYHVILVRAPQVYSSAIRDILEPNQGTWPVAGVTLGSSQFVNLGLQGVGRIPASAKDPATGESLGSISDMQITGFVRNPNGSFSGTMQTLPDRGYNSGLIYSNYAARLNTYTFTFTPYTAPGTTADQNQVALTFTGSARFTCDHDENPATTAVYTTGLPANGPAAALFGTTVPVVLQDTTQSDGTITNRLTVDAEGLILDTRSGKTGSGWIGDEYGAYIYHFNAAKQIDGQLQLPAALVPHAPVGTTNFLSDPPANGRRINQGMEGLAQSPDGTRLFALLQSATIQDSGSGNPGRSNARLVVYDLSASDTPNDPVAQYVIQLPRADDTGSTTNGSTVNRNCAQSAMVALNDHQLLILSRDGNGRGVAGSAAPAFKSILLADLAGATNIDGSFDAEGNAVSPSGTLNPAITPIAWTEALNLLGKLNPSAAEVAKFGLNLNGGHGDSHTLCEKWEALALVPANDPANRNDYFLFVGNDNDFLSASGAYMDAAGVIQSYDGGLENDTLVLVWRVRLTGPDNQAPFAANAIPNRNAGTGVAFNFAFAANTFTDPENQPLTYSATRSDDSPLPAWLSFHPATRTFSGTPAVADIGSYALKVTAADHGTPALSAVASFTIEVGYPVSIAAASVAEGNSGTTNMDLVVTRSVTTTEFTVNFAAGGTATSGTDYVPVASGTLTFLAGGPATQTIPVTVNGDTLIEVNETVVITLSGIVNTTGTTVLINAAANGTITNDDFVPSRFPATATLTSTVKGFIDLDAAPLTGGAEIPAFDPVSQRAFTSSNSGIQVIDLRNPSAPVFISTIAPASLGVAGLTSNDVSSVSIRKGTAAHASVLAAGIISSPKTGPGYVIFLDAATGALLGSAVAGPNPDHVSFTPDGTKLLVANEGETAGEVPLDTTPGSVSIIDLSGGFASPAVATAGFAAFDAQAATLVLAGVRLFQGGVPSLDFEPEYLAISADGTTAMVTLQEANAVAILDIATSTFTSIQPLGKKNYSTGRHDFSDRDGAGAVALANPATGNPVFGQYMPDAIASFSSGEQTYYITANEGDDRNDFVTPAETTTVGNAAYVLDPTVFPNAAALKNQAVLGRLTVSNAPGLRGDTDNDGDIDEILSYGGRSFTILDAAGNLVFDSGDMIENIMASQFPANFDDGRSDNKGPEPEGVTIATIGARSYAFIALERSHMVLVFEVTNPRAPKFTTGFGRSGDLNPEGLVFVSPADSPSGKALLLVANEVSQTLTIHELDGPVDTNVAAGEVTASGAVLWAHGFGLGTVTFEYSTDQTFLTGVQIASAVVTEGLKPCKVVISGLTAGTPYFYRASGPHAATVASGKFKTPAAPGTMAGLRFGVTGDQRGELAPFPSIKNAAANNLDFFLQLGDNIYGDVASPDLPAAQARSLSDYRIRHNEIYSTRYGLNTYSELRSSTAIMATIDDHEVTNDFSGAEPRTSDSRFSADTGSLISDTETFLNGMQAFREYMPLDAVQYGATGDATTANRAKLYRYTTHGRDAAAFVLDARSFRSAPLPSVADITNPAQVGAFLAGAFTPGRTMLGARQLADFKADLLTAQQTGVTWKFVFGPEPMQNFGPLGGEDRYEGYAYERTEILKFIDDNLITNVVFVAADFHGTVVNRLSYQMGPGQPQIQTKSLEIITGSVAYDKPFGPTIVDLAMAAGLAAPGTDLFYQAQEANGKEALVFNNIINPSLAALGYNQVGIATNPLPNAQLISGLYTATNSYGWTEFTIDPASQKLNFKTWGIAPYSKAELDADPAAVTARTPAIVSEFEMTPELFINPAATAGLPVIANSSPLNLSVATGASPPGGTFSGPGIMGETFDPALAPPGTSVISYTFGTRSVSFEVTVSTAAAMAAAPSNALSIALKSSLVLSDNGLASGAGGAEIPAFDPVSKRAFAASNVGIQVVDLTDPAAPVLLAPIDPTASGLGSKDISHVVVRNGVLAVSIIASPDKTLPGTVAFYQADDGTLLGSVAVGAVPDQLAFTPDGTKVLVAIEGEMAPATSVPPPAVRDPEGAVSIIDVSGGFASLVVQTATFNSFNGQETALRANGVRIIPGNSASMDLEPEYLAISPDGTKAMVTLQEANAIAILDIASAAFTAINPLGLKNYSALLADFSDRDGTGNVNAIELKTGLPAFGMFMPDGISSYQSGGQTYYVTANEGDDRNDFLEPDETTTVNAVVTVGGVTTPLYDLDDTLFPDEGTIGGSGAAGAPGTGLKGNDQLGRLSVSNLPGLRGDLDDDGDIDRILSLGGRSFSILDAAGQRIFDSGDVIDRILTTYYPALYDDSRSDNKSAEPEGVSIAVLEGKTYAFIGLERSHSVLVFDVTDPANVTFTTLANRAGDLNPEGLLNISAADSPTGKPLLLVANEVSFTLSTYEIAPEPAALQLQILHYYGESGLLGIQTAPVMGALIDKFDDEVANTIVIGEGDSYIPGPWLVGGADPSLNRVIHTGTFTATADTTAVPLAQADIAIMNAFGTTVSALGNHEFDLGSPVLSGAIAAASSATVGNWAGAQFPLISANLDFASDSSLRGLADSTLGGTVSNNYRGNEVSSIRAKIAPYAVKTIGGQKVGFVGATTYDLLSRTSPNGTKPRDDGNAATDDLQEVAAYLQGSINALLAIGVNKIIMVDQLDTLQRNKDLASLLTGVDVMVAGGGHERMGDATDIPVAFSGHDAGFIADSYPIVTAGSDGRPMLIVTTDTEYSYLGRLVVVFDSNGELVLADLDPAINGAWAASEASLQAAYGTAGSAASIIAGSTIGTKVKAITDAINSVVVAKDGNLFGYTSVYLEGDRVFGRTQEVNLGDITADANAWKAKAALGLPSSAAVFSLKNGGGIRASLGSVAPDGRRIPPVANPLTGKPEGAISQLDIENALRFDNKLMVFDTTPAGLLGILEFAAGLSSGPHAQNGGYPQVGNIRFSYDSTRPAGAKVRSVALMDDNGAMVAKIVENGAVLPAAPALIQVVTLNFTANGGDGYPIKNNPANPISPAPALPGFGTNFRFLLPDGTVSGEIPDTADFTAAAVVPANALGEQKAFSDFLAARHPTAATAYDVAETPVALDPRIQQINAPRTDSVLFSPVEIWRLDNFGSAAGSGNESNLGDYEPDGVLNLLEFAFGTNPASSSSGPGELVYHGTFAGGGALAATGLPITRVVPVPGSVDFRAVFIRRRDYLAARLTYTPQFSTNLAIWQDSTGTPTVLADDGTYQVVSVPYPRFIAGRKARFFRILVNLAP